ncbi:sensor histidine kinase [Streptomyces marincola]|uniref:sensor histidine kinase n=1 Tax=Streptomyces marincola TaxID=2878388 RepID=UPI001CF2F8A0|nr:sensor histidine kinase [Streptomyces marincola]UCM89393.1 sensor histidine kinase [Streptomyces marincola]
MGERSGPTREQVDSAARLAGTVVILIGLAAVVHAKVHWLSDDPVSGHIAPVLLLTSCFLALSYRLVRCAMCGWREPDDIWRELGLFSCATIVLIVYFQAHSGGLAMTFVGVVVLAVRLLLAALLALPVLGTTWATFIAEGLSPFHLLAVLALVLSTGTAYFFVGWITSRYQEAVRSAARQRQEALVEERMRFARDLHDVLGHSLSVIALQSELGARLVATNPEGARSALKSVADLSRSSIADVREVANGYRMRRLAAEIGEVVDVLRMAGVAVECDDVPDELPPNVEQTLAWVARESVTNILRHSDAARCRMRLSRVCDRVTFEISNDGVGPWDGQAGSGLLGLRDRVEAQDGVLVWGPHADSWYSVRADVPLAAAPGGARAGGRQ